MSSLLLRDRRKVVHSRCPSGVVEITEKYPGIKRCRRQWNNSAEVSVIKVYGKLLIPLSYAPQ
jgi:hypothetical protein